MKSFSWDDEKVLEVDGGEKEKKKTFSVKVLNSFMSPVDGHLDWFQFFYFINNAAIKLKGWNKIKY